MDYEPFHIRERNRLREGQPVVYKYDELPDRFRTQVVRILYGVIGDDRQSGGIRTVPTDRRVESFGPSAVWKVIGTVIADELGTGSHDRHGVTNFETYMFRYELPVDEQLTAIEIAFRVVDRIPPDYQETFQLPMNSREAISKLNNRFRRHDLGYAFEVDRLVRIDSQFLHGQVVEPALQLLGVAGFEGAQTLFLNAHEHFRHGENDDAILDAARAFETTMQHICDEMTWAYPERPQAKHLIQAVTDNGLFPNWHQNHMNSLKTLLKGLPTVRNKEASHADTEGQDAPDEMAAFAIHLAASNIVFMVESFERKRRA